MTQLEAAYRRLLLAYPRSFRRHRGPEVITTLMDAARPEQQRPTVREAANLILNGLLWRFRLPHGAAYRVVAVIAALMFGLFASAAGSQIAWQSADTMPTTAEVMTVAQLATTHPVGLGHPTESGFLDACDKAETNSSCESLIPAGADPAVRSVYTGHQLPQHEVNAAVEQARARLMNAGWTVSGIVYSNSPQAMPHSPEQTIFWAAKGDLVVRVSGDPTNKYAPFNSNNFIVSVHQQVPALVTIAAGTGLLLGTLGGLMLSTWALRAFQRLGFTGRAAMAVTGIPALVLALLLEIAAITLAVYYARALGWSHQDSRFTFFILAYAQPLSLAALVAFLVSSATAAFAPRTDAPPKTAT